jgi:hypothetical protein
MSRPLSFKESLVVWQTMADNMAELLDELPHLRPLHASMSALLARARELQAEHDVHTSRLREVNYKRTVAAREGRELRHRMAALLQGTFGRESQRLLRYGVKPRPRDQRRNRPTAAERAQRATVAASPAESAATESPASDAAPAGAERPGDPSAVN